MTTPISSDAFLVAEGITVLVGEASPYGITWSDSGQLTPQGPEAGTLAETPAIALGASESGALADGGEVFPTAPSLGTDSASLAEGVTIVFSDPTPDGITLSELGVVSDIFPEDGATLDDRDTLLTVDDFGAEGTLADTALATVSHAQADTGTLSENGVVVSSVVNLSFTDSDGISVADAAAIAALLASIETGTASETPANAVEGTDTESLAAEVERFLATLPSTDSGAFDDTATAVPVSNAIQVSVAATDSITLADTAIAYATLYGVAIGAAHVAPRTAGAAHITERLVGTAHVEA